MDAVIEGI